MNAAERLRQLSASARRRVAVRAVTFGAAPVVALVALTWRVGGGPAALAVSAAAVLALVVAGMVLARRIDAVWLARRLDALDPRMEDSAGLLFGDIGPLSPLQRLQRDRLAGRLAAAPPPELRPRWHRRALATTVAVSLAAAVAVLAWPASGPWPSTAPVDTTPGGRAAAARTRLTASRLTILPPGYTGLPSREQAELAARVPESSRLRWSLRFAPRPDAAFLQFHDGSRFALRREGDDWTAERRIDTPALYRVVVPGRAGLWPDRLHRIEVVRDTPPQLKTVAPAGTLTLRGRRQQAWSLVFEARDDHGLAANASLRITTARGSGENVAFEERTIALPGVGDARRRRYSHTFALDALALAPGDDLVVQLSVSDRRPSGAQTTRSPSYLLRWPPEAAMETTGVEGVLARTLPAYFRSQRQVILDTEALLARRRALAATEFEQRSDAIGVDQRLLRLRYGQFLGQEDEQGEQPLLPTADAEESGAHAGEDAAAPTPDANADEHAHTPAPPAKFGEAGNVLEAFGHTHDDSEAATLFDPETRRILKAALDQMWQAELHLRQARPELALPYEYKALDLIKQVQQADRVYVAKVGAQLPPIDESRRLSGKRDGLVPPRDLLQPAEAPTPALADLWRALEAPERTVPDPMFEAAEAWLRAQSGQTREGREGRGADALGALAALDAFRRDAGCHRCRQELQRALWPLLARPLPAPLPRTRPDASGQAYLDALQAEDVR